MAIHTALSLGDIAKAAGSHSARWWLVAVANTTVGTATVVSLNVSAASITVNGASGGWGSVQAGHVAVITSGSTLRGIYRVREPGDSTTLYIMQSAAADPGLATISLRTAGLTAGDTVTVFERRDVFSVLPRIIASSGAIYEDFDDTVTTDNYQPGPVVNIYFNGDPGDYPVYADAGLYSYATITLTTDTVLWPTSSTITAYSWAVPGSWGAPIAGSPTTNTVTYQVPVAGQTNYVISLTLTENGGTTRMGWRDVWVLDRTSNGPITVTRLDSLTSDRSGTRATITISGSGVTAIPGKGDKVVLFGEIRFGGQIIASTWTKVSGWVTNAVENTDPGTRSITLNIEGSQGMLTLLGSYSQYVRSTTGVPANWQELYSSLCMVDYLIYWLAARRAKALATIVNWTPSNVTNTAQDLPLWTIANAGNLYQQMVTLAVRLRANIGFNPDGEAMVRRHPSLIAYALRAANVDTRVTLTASMVQSVKINDTKYPSTRRTRGEAFQWDGATTLPTPLLADSPGASAGQGTNDDTLQSQLVTDQANLNQVTGDYWALQNNPYASIELRMRGLWGLLIYCAEMTFIRLQLAAQYRATNIALDINVIPRSVTISETAPGVYSTSLEVEGETAGSGAVTVPVPVQVVNPSTYTSPPPAPPPTELGAVNNNGNTVIVITDDLSTMTTTWFESAPAYVDCSGNYPTNTTWAFYLDPFSPFLLNNSSGLLYGYVLKDDGLWYCANMITPSQIWTHTLTLPTIDYWGRLKCSGFEPGVVTIQYSGTDDGNITHLSEYTSANTSAVLRNTQAVGQTGSAGGMDINPFLREVLISATLPGSQTMYRSTNGGVATIIQSAIGTGSQEWAQRPLLTLSGATNLSGSSEVYYYGGSAGGQLYRSVNGGASAANIAPGPGVAVPFQATSMAYTEDANRLVVCDYGSVTPHVYTSTTAGASWTDQGAVGTGRFQAQGWFPRPQNGNFGIYAGSGLLLYSPDSGVTWLDKTGDWITQFGAPVVINAPGFAFVVPLF